MNQDRARILFIAGAGRSGSTLLSRILGQIDGLCAVGELRWVWEESFGEDAPCGCGAPFRSCPFWEAVVEKAFGSFDGIDPGEVLRLMEETDRERYLPQLIFAKSPRYRMKLMEYSRNLIRLYKAIHQVSGSQLVVDSSKDASYAYVLANMPEVQLYVVHLVRDSRAVAYSWQRKKFLRSAANEEIYMDLYGPAVSSLSWLKANLLSETLKFRAEGYLRIRYEDFVTNPQKVVLKILNLATQEVSGRSLMDGNKLELDTDHTISGNVVRFKRGNIELRLDEEWKNGMKPSDTRLVTALTWPLLLRYGYLGTRG